MSYTVTLARAEQHARGTFIVDVNGRGWWLEEELALGPGLVEPDGHELRQRLALRRFEAMEPKGEEER